MASDYFHRPFHCYVFLQTELRFVVLTARLTKTKNFKCVFLENLKQNLPLVIRTTTTAMNVNAKNLLNIFRNCLTTEHLFMELALYSILVEPNHFSRVVFEIFVQKIDIDEIIW